MSGDVKIRNVAAWMVVMLAAASVAMAHVWKQQSHARLSRELALASRACDALAAEVLLLETETRGLRQYSRLEAVATNRLGMLNPHPPTVIRIDPTRAEGEVRVARWKGVFR